MRILLSSAPLHGHILQLVPFAWALRTAGHEILVAVPEEYGAGVREAGLPAVASCSGVTMRQMIGYERNGSPVPWTSDPEARLRRSGSGFGRLAAAALDGTRSLVRRWRPTSY